MPIKFFANVIAVLILMPLLYFVSEKFHDHKVVGVVVIVAIFYIVDWLKTRTVAVLSRRQSEKAGSPEDSR